MVKTPKGVEVSPITPLIGAEIHGLDLADNIAENAEFLRETLFAHGVICFRRQKLDHEQHLALAECFGEVEVPPIVEGMEEFPAIVKMHKPAGEEASFGVGWHSDNSFMRAPSLGSILFAETIPPVGGDTLFASQTAAWQHLSQPMKSMLSDMNAIHSARDAYSTPSALEKYDGKTAIRFKNTPAVNEEATHKICIRHPNTGEEALYVNPMFTKRIAEMPEEESKALLNFLFAHSTREDFQCRFRWEAGSVVIWDNRLVQHAAINDYQDYERIIYRITATGEAI